MKVFNLTMILKFWFFTLLLIATLLLASMNANADRSLPDSTWEHGKSQRLVYQVFNQTEQRVMLGLTANEAPTKAEPQVYIFPGQHALLYLWLAQSDSLPPERDRKMQIKVLVYEVLPKNTLRLLCEAPFIISSTKRAEIEKGTSAMMCADYTVEKASNADNTNQLNIYLKKF